MAKQTTPKHGVTPPKGRPTRARSGRLGRQRVFGPAWQWLAVTLLLVLVFIMLVALTDGGDFNPFNGSTGAPLQGIVTALTTST